MNTSPTMSATFWGVRGSIPSPLTGKAVEAKIATAVQEALKSDLKKESSVEAIQEWMRATMPFDRRATFGGNTTCVEVRCGDELIILDMGTGLRELGLSLFPQMFRDKGVKGTVLQSHVHHDHIQGYPFWGQLFVPREKFNNAFTFYGGLAWEKSLEDVLRGQMNPPVFPVDHREIEKIGLGMSFNTVHDGLKLTIPSKQGDINVTCRKLFHPQETYGYRIEFGGKVLTFCTDHEPFASAVHRPLLELAKDADVFITDCQYSEHEYNGEGGKVQKMGWGHSYPEYIARVAAEAKPKLVVTTHHDPQSSDQRVVELAAAVEKIGGIDSAPAYEGLVIKC